MIGSGFTCSTCCYWSASRGASGGGFRQGQEDEPLMGQCRRFPPFMGSTVKGPRAQWPITLASHWCGEHGEVKRTDGG